MGFFIVIISHGQLGHGSAESEARPRIVEALEGIRITALAAGGWHTLFLAEGGDVYSCGRDDQGAPQLQEATGALG